ncbi:4-phosphoerythronate dehydrogenase [Gracilimonas sp.]|uniref:4-phosphoerythronate dehydrogenase n=1 Tax=Gracilimonas sp. TaxID=1974203 RepID=UPI0028710B77|nr:4-phosphoerythronate dehydrogenase [Gracilimonas sp.]
MIHAAADQNLYKIKELKPPQVQLSLYNPSDGIPDLNGIDALILRTVTHLNADTLPHIPSSLKFIGTGSSGTDHLDIDYLESNGIHVADANGCNARSVAEYVMTALLLWREEHNPDQPFGKVGVIGVGKAGSAVVEILTDFGIKCVEYDPPREQRDSTFNSSSIEEVLDCEILTFHVPLNKKGEYPTYHWLNEEKLSGHQFQLIINAARGGVIDEIALMKFYVEGRIQNYVLDVWEGEPDFNTKVAKHAFIATPHIAGYSEQSKVRATEIIFDKMADYFDLKNACPQYEKLTKTVDLAHIEYDLVKLLTRLHPILGYDKALRDLSARPDKKILFRNLRNEWPYRYEYNFLKVRSEILNEFPELKTLGVSAVG